MLSTLTARLLLGPLYYFRSDPAGAAALSVAVILLSALTQVGGAVLWAVFPLLDFLHRKARRFGRRLAYGLLGICTTAPR